MTFGSSSSSQRLAALKLGERAKLPLVPYPTCGAEILELQCGEGSKVPGAIFFKSRFHNRDDESSCPLYLFADKYERMLIRKGLIEKNSTTVAGLNQVDEMKIAIGQIEEFVQANRTKLVPLLEDFVSLKNGAVRIDEKLQKLVDIGKLVALCLVVLVVFVLLGVLIMLVK